MENDFLTAYLEGKAKASKLEHRIELCRKLMEELQNSLEPGMIEVASNSPFIWRLNIDSKEYAATIAVGFDCYILEYLTSRVLCSDISELRAAILDMFRDPEMH